MGEEFERLYQNEFRRTVNLWEIVLPDKIEYHRDLYEKMHMTTYHGNFVQITEEEEADILSYNRGYWDAIPDHLKLKWFDN